MASVAIGASTSMPSTYSHASVWRENLASEFAAERSPLAGGEYHDVALAFQCFVGELWIPGRYIETASFVKAPNGNETGSLTLSSPAGTVTASCPPNVTAVRSETAFVPAIPIVTCPKVVASLPKRFDKWMRRTAPARCGVTIMRRVWSVRISGTGRPVASIGTNESVGLDVQLATQCWSGCAAALEVADGTVRRPVARSIAVIAPTPGTRISLLLIAVVRRDVAD